MASQVRIENISNGCRYKRGAIERAIDNCSVMWVEHGVSVRNLTLDESIQARNEQARLTKPLPFAEIPGIRFTPPASGIHATRKEGALMWKAHDFLVAAGYA